MQTDWAYQEFTGSIFGDSRCRRSIYYACESLAENASLSFSMALGSRRKAVSRILHREETTSEGLLRGHIRATKQRCQAYDRVLIASDTSFFDFTSHKATEGLGRLSNRGKGQGFLLHSALALTPEGLPLGLLHQKTWVRDEALVEVPKEKRDPEDKESKKWLEALRGVEKALPTSQKALLIQDREADIFSFFAAKRNANIDLLIRAAQPRNVFLPGAEKHCSLWKAAEQAPVLGTLSFTWHPQSKERREVVLTLRSAQITVSPPRNGRKQDLSAPLLWVVFAREETPPPDTEALEWVLLASYPVSDLDAAVQSVSDYSHRWAIERFHYTLKSGCQFERLQMDTFAMLQKALSLYSVVAWRLLYLTYLARELPETPAEEVLSGRERELLEQKTGRALLTVRDAILAVASLVHFRPTPSAPNPGVKTLWIGFRKLADMLEGYKIARNIST